MMNIFIINIPQVSQCSSTDVLFEKEKTTKKKKKIKVSKKKQPDHCREDFYSDDDFVEWCAPRRQDAAAPPAPAPPASPPSKPAPTFPDAACPLSRMDRGQVVSNVRSLLSFISPGSVNGEGECPAWKRVVPTARISSKIKKAVGLEDNIEYVALKDFRSWSPGMRLGRNFKAGPGASCSFWRRKAPWIPFLRLVIAVVSLLYGKSPETDVIDVDNVSKPDPKR